VETNGSQELSAMWAGWLSGGGTLGWAALGVGAGRGGSAAAGDSLATGVWEWDAGERWQMAGALSL